MERQISLEAVKNGIAKTEMWREGTYTDAAIRHADGLRLRWRRRLGGGGGGSLVGGRGVGGGEKVVGADAAGK
jgi:hypothetical protein